MSRASRSRFSACGGTRSAKRRSSKNFRPVSLVRPLCGLDNYAADTLRSTFDLDYPHYEILFCVASANDPVVPLVENLIAEYAEREREAA